MSTKKCCGYSLVVPRKTCVVGTHEKRLAEALLMSTTTLYVFMEKLENINIFCLEKNVLSGAVLTFNKTKAM